MHPATNRPRQYGLLGWPVKHSVSPQMQEAGFKALGIDATYTLLPVEPENLAAKVQAMKDDGFCGWNITVPHKGPMIEFLDAIEPAASKAASVNTVCNRDGRLQGYSTDGFGLEMAIKEAFDVDVANHRFLFWGTGGAARATATYFAFAGAAECVLVNRTISKAEDLAGIITELAPECGVRILPPSEVTTLKRLVTEVDVVIQSTSVGLQRQDPVAIPLELLAPGLRIMDMIYKRTTLLAEAEKAGCKTADGRAMLLYQGVKSFEIWTAQRAPVPAMRRALLSALRDGLS